MEKLKKSFKVKFLVWAAFLILSVNGTLPYSIDVIHAETTVYVTPTGSKYHSHKCGRGTYTPASLSDALARGLTPCSKCFGGGGGYSTDTVPAPGDSGGTSTAPVKINKTSLILVKGQTSTLKIKNASEKISWKSSKKSVATVSKSGKVKAKKKGKAVITAQIGSVKKTCSVTVESPKLNLKSVTLNLGKTKKLKLSGCKHSVKWSSSKPSVAKVSKGKITAKKSGTAKITAKVHGKSFTCKVTVKKPAVQKVILEPNSVKMGFGKEMELKVRTVPANAMDYYSVSVRSSDSSVVDAYLDEYDYEEFDDEDDEFYDAYDDTVILESAYKSGSAVIYVTVGGVTAQCKADVAPDKISSLQLSASSVSMKPSGSYSIHYTAAPADAAKYYDAEWSSSNNSVATVKKSYSQYAAINAVGEGKADITVKLGGVTATCHVVVAKPKVTKLELRKEELNLKPDEEQSIRYTVAPEDAARYHEEIWSSADESVVTVEKDKYFSQYANLTAVGEGETDVTLTLGGVTATCHVVVAKPEVTNLELSKEELNLKPDEEQSIRYTVAPEDAARYHEEIWSSADESVVTVEKDKYFSQYANLTAVGEGETDVTLTLGGITATCHVVVKP